MSRLNRVVDRARQIEVNLGLRPYAIWLTWMKWGGGSRGAGLSEAFDRQEGAFDDPPERGEGTPIVVCSMPLLPIPRVDDISGLSRVPFSAGRYPVGSIRVTGISASYREELLLGRVLPDNPEAEVPEPYEFFWELVEDGRHGPAPLRRRFTPASEPFLDAVNQQWVIVLERQSGDMERDGKPAPDPRPPVRDPMRDGLERPDDD